MRMKELSHFPFRGRRSPSVSSRATPRTPSVERSLPKLSLKKLARADGSDCVDKRCTDGQLSARSVETVSESGKAERNRISLVAAG